VFDYNICGFSKAFSMNAVGYFHLKSHVSVWLHDRGFVKTISKRLFGKRDCFRVNCDCRLLNNASNPLRVPEGNAEQSWRHQPMRDPRLCIGCLHVFHTLMRSFRSYSRFSYVRPKEWRNSISGRWRHCGTNVTSPADLVTPTSYWLFAHVFFVRSLNASASKLFAIFFR
jgi:hypothetical protein